MNCNHHGHAPAQETSSPVHPDQNQTAPKQQEGQIPAPTATTPPQQNAGRVEDPDIDRVAMRGYD